MAGENRFFRYLWRFNAILAAIIGLAGIGYIGLMSSWYIKPILPIPGLAQSDNQPRTLSVSSPKYHLSQELSAVSESGIPTMFFSLTQVLPRGSSWVSVAPIVNILQMDGKTNKSRWLFPDFSRVIVSKETLFSWPDKPSHSDLESPKPIGLLLTVQDTDTNHDGSLGPGDRLSLYVYLFGTDVPKKVLTVDRVVALDASRAGNLFMMFRNGEKTFAATYSMPDFRLLSQAPVAGLPQLAEVPSQETGIQAPR
jgi:hypothetical protein